MGAVAVVEVLAQVVHARLLGELLAPVESDAHLEDARFGQLGSVVSGPHLGNEGAPSGRLRLALEQDHGSARSGMAELGSRQERRCGVLGSEAWVRRDVRLVAVDVAEPITLPAWPWLQPRFGVEDGKGNVRPSTMPLAGVRLGVGLRNGPREVGKDGGARVR